jgi:hypothetical protein
LARDFASPNAWQHPGHRMVHDGLFARAGCGLGGTPKSPMSDISITIENAYLAAQLISFWSVYQAVETSVYIDRIRGRIGGRIR